MSFKDLSIQSSEDARDYLFELDTANQRLDAAILIIERLMVACQDAESKIEMEDFIHTIRKER